jgi:hypothetical protein
MNENHGGETRSRLDRRRRPTSPLDALRFGGRRRWPRREEERHGAFFIDRFDASTLAMIVVLLGLTLVDGLLTLRLLEINCEDVNQFIGYLLKRGPMAFLAGKYVLTAAGLPFLVVYKYYPLFGTRFRAGYLLPVFLGLYLVLLCYQWALLRGSLIDPCAGRWPA